MSNADINHHHLEFCQKHRPPTKMRTSSDNNLEQSIIYDTHLQDNEITNKSFH